jgi:hypothetical protein
MSACQSAFSEHYRLRLQSLYVSLSEGARGSFAPRKRQSTPFRPPHDGRVEEVELDSPPGLLVIFSTDHMYRRDAKLHAEVILDAPAPLAWVILAIIMIQAELPCARDQCP